MSTTEVVPSVSVAHMVNQRAAMMKRLQHACTLIQEAAEIAESAHLGMPQIIVSREYSRNSHSCNIASARIKTDSSGRPWTREASPEKDLQDCLRLGVDAAAWQYLMHQSGMRSLMDATARAKWDKAIADGDIPELTDANIRSTFGMLHDSRGEMFERGVLAVFKSLAWCYKTNLPQKFGKRIVMRYIASAYYGGSKADELDDLERVMHVLDGKPEPDHRSGMRAALASVRSRLGDPRGVCETEYLHIRCFKNGNGHITFKRLDLAEKMNLILAKHHPNALPAPK